MHIPLSYRRDSQDFNRPKDSCHVGSQVCRHTQLGPKDHHTYGMKETECVARDIFHLEQDILACDRSLGGIETAVHNTISYLEDLFRGNNYLSSNRCGGARRTAKRSLRVPILKIPNAMPGAPLIGALEFPSRRFQTPYQAHR